MLGSILSRKYAEHYWRRVEDLIWHGVIVFRTELDMLPVCELNEVLMELEAQIKDYSETLIAELAHRDELEYEKELKNSFISHLLAVQTKRRQHNLDKKKNKVGIGVTGSGGASGLSNGNNPDKDKTFSVGSLHSKVSFSSLLQRLCTLHFQK